MFYLQLALRLGRSLRELFATVSSEELTLWRAFDRIQPVGDWRKDLASGIVAASVMNSTRGRSVKAFNPFDFMPFFKKKEVPLSQQIREGLIKAAGHKVRK